ncbi:uncharacterized protein LOC127102991 [Lathyrus oleraceus]|uniref:uncharacterized protein LOC127102991 n=1 Tax=Pisum sativum TaxID=3888 RepID=UPI0021CF0BF5|nr:uncharacterized protein LOC127102991 [Pisum sativum]
MRRNLVDLNENLDGKSKSIALKVDSKEVEKEDNSEEDENFMLLVKRLGHIKTYCPKLSKKNSFNKRKYSKSKRAYIVWEDNEVSSSSDSESEECVNLALMDSHHFDDEEEEVSNETSSHNDTLGSIDELLKSLKDMKKDKLDLKNVLSQQRYSNDKSGLGYSKFNRPSTSKTIFVKVCLKTTSNLWYLDSGCSKHMTRDISKFSNLMLKAKVYVTYGDNNKVKILGKGKVRAPPFTSIEDKSDAFKAFKKIYNKRTLTIEESMHASFDDTNTSKEDIVVCDDDDIIELPSEEVSNDQSVSQPEQQREVSQQDPNHIDLTQEWRIHRDHPIDKVICDLSKGVSTRLNIEDAKMLIF